MNIQDLIDVNNLWVNIYPYLVKQILEIYPPGAQEALPHQRL
jgi:hypothetical protein